ncbi:hypothetical protein LINGRAHAP2_LOCUS12606 [Linum grandiflorum]
MKFVSLFL